MRKLSRASDLTDREWEVIKILIPSHKPGGRPRRHDVREILNGILYVRQTGSSWNGLSYQNLSPPWAAYRYYRQWQRTGVWEELEETLQALGRDVSS